MKLTYIEIGKLIKKKDFILGLGTTGKPLQVAAIKEIKNAVSSITDGWKGERRSHTGGVRTKMWLETIAKFIEKTNYDLINWLNSFDCPTEVVTNLKKIKFSSRDSAKFLALVGHPKLNGPEIPICVTKWYPKHKKCFPPRINDEVAKFFLRTGCITIKSAEQYHELPEKGFDTIERDFVGVSYPIFYGNIFDEFKNVSDPALLAERIISYCSESLDGVCTDEKPKCKNCPITNLCTLSTSSGKSPEIVRATDPNTEFWSGRTEPKSSIGCITMKI